MRIADSLARVVIAGPCYIDHHERGCPSLRFLQEPALSGAEGVDTTGSILFGAASSRGRENPLRRRQWRPRLGGKESTRLARIYPPTHFQGVGIETRTSVMGTCPP
jgi:hypothetical protein